MKHLFIYLFTVLSLCVNAQTFKSKSIKLKCTTPEGWNVTEFGGKTSWDESGNDLCKCSGLLFVKEHEEGKLKVLIYPSTVNGLDSAKRNMVGNLRFEKVEKYDKTRNKAFSFEKRKSNFFDTKTNKKSYEVIKYKAKHESHFYIIYAWHENMQMMSPDIEKELFEVINAIEPL
jgi:hypothetical protein